MRSPFPGMDPYIEACHLWEDFHHDLLIEIKHALAPLLPARYVVRAGERSYMVLSAKNGEDEYRMQADVTLARKPGPGAPAESAATAVLDVTEAAAAPITMRALIKSEFREGFLEIKEAHGDRQLVTSIEILSPSNKRFGSEGWFEYLRKRQACVSGWINFVEIDLLRRGRRMPMEDDWPDSPYYLLVCRKEQAPRCTVWEATYSRPLQPIPIPLLPSDPDIVLDLEPLVQKVYDVSHYDLDIDYRQPLSPPLAPAEVAWLDERLRQP